MNLSKVVGNFVEDQKPINAQINQRIEKVECSMDKRIEGLHKILNQKIDTMQSSISGLNNQPQVLEKGRFPSQTLPNPRGVNELSFSSEPAKRMDEVQAIITLRSGKEIEQPVSKPAGKNREREEEEPEHIFIKEDSMKESMPPPFPQALRSKKKASKQERAHQVPIILRRPFLATANAIINFKNGVMQLTFGNMALELNIFHLSNKDKQAENKE